MPPTQQGWTQFVRFLASSGARLDVKDRGGATALDAIHPGRAGGASRPGVSGPEAHPETAVALRELMAAAGAGRSALIPAAGTAPGDGSAPGSGAIFQCQQILGPVDIDGRVGHGNPQAAVGMPRKDRPGTCIAAQLREAGKALSREHRRHAGVTVCSSRQSASPAGRRQAAGQPLQVEGRHGRLIGQRHQHAFADRPADWLTPSRSELARPSSQLRLIERCDAGLCLQQRRELLRMGSQHHRDRPTGHLGGLGDCLGAAAVCPPMRTSCLGEPKRLAAPAARTRTCRLLSEFMPGCRYASGVACAGRRRPLEFAGFFLLNSNFGHNIR